VGHDFYGISWLVDLDFMGESGWWRPKEADDVESVPAISASTSQIHP
jgi:hypothetical protein